MSYDPDPRRRKRKRSKRRKRTHAPARGMAYGYGSLRGKPYRVGRRGGLAWSGGRKLRYDPQRFARLRGYGRRFRGYAGRAGSKAETFLNRHGTITGFFAALLYGVYTGYNHLSSTGGDYMSNLKSEYQFLLGKKSGVWNTGSWLKYKFLGISPDTGQGGAPSAWVLPFWLSLIGFIISKVGGTFKIPPRILTPLGKISKGALIASTMGALLLPGSYAGQYGEPSGSLNPPQQISYYG
jgi:hypothetical protein